jgi:hypothetical protein
VWSSTWTNGSYSTARVEFVRETSWAMGTTGRAKKTKNT